MSMSDIGHSSSSARRLDVPDTPRRKHDMSPRHPLTRHRYGSSDSLDKIMAAHARLNSSPTSREKQLEDDESENEDEGSVHTPRHDGAGLPEPEGEGATLVETGFDEEVLKRLCDIDCGVPLLVDRIKQSMISCKEAAAFFKKRAQEEEEYGKSMQKLARSTLESYNTNGGKAGSFVNSWHRSMKMHETMGENRIRYAHRLKEMSDELANLAKEVDKNVRTTRDLATKCERDVLSAEEATEKQRHKVEGTAEDLQQLLQQKNSSDSEAFASPTKRFERRGNPLGKAVAKGGQLLKGRNAGYSERHEQELRVRLASYSETYRRTFTQMQGVRQEYFAQHLPRLLRAFKESLDELDLGTQYHLARYAFLYESVVLSDGTTLAPPDDDAEGLKPAMEAIDDRSDFTSFMQNYAFVHGGANFKGPKRDAPAETRVEAGYLAALPPYTNGAGASKASFPGARATFGVDLGEQMARDDVDVPTVVVRCCEAVERHGLGVQGIYRLSGTATKVQRLKELLDRDMDAVDLDSDEWTSDINNVSSVLKLWLRDLPEPIITFEAHQPFLEAARVENERLRCIRLHERVNELPDANYMTLKHLMGHLHKVVQNEAENSMSVQNVAIVFAPTLFGQLPANGETNGASAVMDAGAQVKAIETILVNYVDIFVDENEPQSVP